jgi:uncharacterized membrane protein YbhN (UPF0104 family)
MVFTIGSAGVLVPTPGSVGSFHLLVSKSLVMVAHVDQDLALAVATTLHLLTFVLVICVVAGVCFLAQSLLSGRRQPAA